VNRTSDSQLRKHESPIVLTEAGMQIDKSDEHWPKAKRPIWQRTEWGSNVTVESDVHPWKHELPIVRTEAGMQIDDNDEQLKKTERSIHESLEPSSNVTDERD
jgi:hypothetical protein